MYEMVELYAACLRASLCPVRVWLPDDEFHPPQTLGWREYTWYGTPCELASLPCPLIEVVPPEVP